MSRLECLLRTGMLSEGVINEIAMEMMCLCMELKEDIGKIKGNSLMVSATHSLFVNKIKEVLSGEVASTPKKEKKDVISR